MPNWNTLKKTVRIITYPVLPACSSRTKKLVRTIVYSALCTTAVLLFQFKIKSYDICSIKDVQPITWQVKKQTEDFSHMNWQDAIEYVQTPAQVQKYIAWLCSRPEMVFDEGQYYSGFKKTHEGRTPVDCTEVAYASAALLSDNGYPPLILMLSTTRVYPTSAIVQRPKGHMVFVYKSEGKFGSIGIEPDDFQKPVHENLESLVCHITDSHADPKNLDERYCYFSLFNLNENDPDYITTERDLYRLFLIDSLYHIPEK